MKDTEKDIDQALNEAEMIRTNTDEFEAEVIFSTDGKHSVIVRSATVSGRKKAFEYGRAVYESILDLYGTKQEQAKKVYSEPLEEVKNSPGYCPIHKLVMRRYEKNGRSWYSHNVDGAWCNGGKERT